ncbi:biotin transporter BioY [Micromonospora sp. NBC_01655]|uniref:biotin transporter BioY n=1 Tax=Micromonospora sp. NBC_01655 TaxID=2975983 RepID=UPI002257668F|nr:biotin transporter BioY [Micromonospora sp. NBC_01655]MCX4469604.1 biotin transporter BioY [Micromonospora sp. NBC_01655]
MTTALSLPTRLPVLAESALPKALTRIGVTVVLGAALTALAAQVVLPIPGSPVPVTGQTFAVLLAAACLGPARGLASQLLYLALGAAGLPVFTQGAHGVHVVVGATGGYLVGFLLAALIVGAGSRRGTDRTVLRELAVLALGSAAIYACGVTWLAIVTGMGLAKAVAVGIVPFLVGDALKVVLAASLLPATWKLVTRLDSIGRAQ